MEAGISDKEKALMITHKIAKEAKYIVQNHTGLCFIMMKCDANKRIMRRSASSVTEISSADFSIIISDIVPSTAIGISRHQQDFCLKELAD